ncbi:MAG: DnaJ domain-containing protein [Bradyrhizobiaceae bacterium]|nr:DnaJ domain-containing protein [Bradyrhizobiaceae bacterium]
MANTLYDVLEVIPTASMETIHAAYRSLIIRYHPDKLAHDPRQQAEAIARTKEINFAYHILSDTSSRARYDEELRGGKASESLLPRSPVIDGPAAATAPPVGPATRGPATHPGRPAPTRGRSATAAAADEAPQQRHLVATFTSAAVGVALILTLPPAANLIFAAVEYSLTGHARYFYQADNPVDAKGIFGSTYLPVLWGWLFANYLFGLISYRLAVAVGEGTAERFGGSFAATNDRLFLFLTFVCVVAVSELFFSAHTMGNTLADMFVLAGAYLAERGIS